MSSTALVTLITGGNKGLGYAIAQALLQAPCEKGYNILLGSRSLQRAQDAVKALQTNEDTANAFKDGKNSITPVELDIDDDKSIDEVRAHITKEHGRLDILVNNAGVNFDSRIASGELTKRQAFNESFNTNVSSTSALTSACIDLLLKSSTRRILFVSSSVGSCGWQSDPAWPINQSPTATGWPKPYSWDCFTYRTTKSAENMMVLEWIRVLKPDGIKIHLVCPGLLATDLGGAGPDALRNMGAKEPITAGIFIRGVLEGKRDNDIGKLINEAGVVPF